MINSDSFILQSTSFSDGADLDPKFAKQGVAGGQNLSPALSWHGAPEGARSFAITMVDPHPVARNWVHWLVVDIPPEVLEVSEGASAAIMPAGARELKTSYGTVGYGGPQPPVGSGKHPYVITVYALSVPRLEAEEGISLDGFLKAIEGKVLVSGKITGYFDTTSQLK